jgi:hypothetical protein
LVWAAGNLEGRHVADRRGLVLRIAVERAVFVHPKATKANGDTGDRRMRVPAESSPDKYAYENKIAERFGGQKELELVVPTPSSVPKPEPQEAAN